MPWCWEPSSSPLLQQQCVPLAAEPLLHLPILFLILYDVHECMHVCLCAYVCACLCVYVRVCVSVHVHECKCPHRPEMLDPLGAGATSGCELPSISPLEEQHCFLTAEPPLWPQASFSFKKAPGKPRQLPSTPPALEPA